MNDSPETSSPATESASENAHSAADFYLGLPGVDNGHSEKEGEKPTGFAAAARKISGRTTDLLAIAVIGIGIFAVSGRLSDWWSTPPDLVLTQSGIVPEVVGSKVAWPEMDIPVAMNLGDFPVSVDRLMIQGDLSKLEQIVFSRLESVLRASSSGSLPRNGESKVARAATKLEGLLTKIDPVRKDADAWQIYRLDEPGTPGFSSMFIGTQFQKGRLRIVTWAMAMPWRGDEWKVFFFQPAQGSKTSVAIPSGAEVTMSMQEPSGAELAAFEAVDDLASFESWQTFYTKTFGRDGWRNTRNWSEQDSRSTARFENGTLAVELILRTENDTLFGLASVIRLPSRKTH